MSKTYYSEKSGIDAKDITMVSVMPCTSKKYEITRSDEMYASGYQDIDYSITTRELARMIKQAGIDFVNLPDSDVDSILGEYTGAGTIFGVTGGVMEAALRSAYLPLGKYMAEYIERPPRMDKKIQRAAQAAARRNRVLKRARLNPEESRIFWEDLIEVGLLQGDPTDDLQYAAFVALGDYSYFDITIKLEVEGV